MRTTWTSAGVRSGERVFAGPGGARAAPQARLERDEDAPRIWAIGGGKGGVGKSVVSSNLAAAIAAAGRRCAIVDADLGGANLHTLLGISRPRYSLSHLLAGDVSRLADLMVQTSVPNLWLVSGNQALLEMANPTHGQKEMIVRQIRALDVDDIVIDLGAGSAFTVLDFFLLARRGLVVVTPEPTSIENAEHFIRVAFYRSLREVARRPDVAARGQPRNDDTISLVLQRHERSWVDCKNGPGEADEEEEETDHGPWAPYHPPHYLDVTPLHRPVHPVEPPIQPVHPPLFRYRP